MADRVVPGPVSNDDCIKEAVCIDTRKIMDSCRDKDCVEELRVYPTVNSVPLIQSAFSVRPRCAELLQCEVSVKEQRLLHRRCHILLQGNRRGVPVKPDRYGSCRV